MLIRISLIALLVLGVIALASFPLPCHPEIDASKYRENYRPTYKDCSSTIGAIFVPLGGFIHTYKDEITALSTLVIAIFTMILGCFTISLARSTRISANAAKRSADAAIAIELPIIKMEPVSLGKGARIKEGIQTHYLCIHFVTFSNVGRSKAFPVELRYGFATGLLPATPQYTFVETFPFNDIFDADPTVKVRKYLASVLEIAPDVRRHIDAGRTAAWFYCEFVYLDFMQSQREAAFCWRWQNVGDGTGWKTDETPAYNC